MPDWRGHDLLDCDGESFGVIDDVYLERDGGRPRWALVSAGLAGLKSVFVPLEGAEESDGAVRVPFSRGLLKGAPPVGTGDQLTEEEERRLEEHYGSATP